MADPMISAVLGVLGCLLVAVTAVGWLRVCAHRVPPAHGDVELAGELGRVAGKRTRHLAAAVLDLDAGARVAFIGADAGTRFEVGSVTKAFTGMLLAEAQRRGEASLDSIVGELLPETAGSPVGSLTLRELCTHTSGLPGLPRSVGTAVRVLCSGLFGTNPYRGLGPAAVLRLAQRQRLSRRGRQRYSNLGASVLGHALARAAGTDFPTLLTERVFTPIGMSATGIATANDAATRGWTAAGRRSSPWVLDGYAPAGGAISTLTDMTLLATALLNRSAPGLASLDPIGQYVTDHPERSSGMFWVIDSVAATERTTVWHNGETGGYSAFLALYPQARRVVVVLANVARATEQQHIALALIRWLINTDPPRTP